MKKRFFAYLSAIFLIAALLIYIPFISYRFFAKLLLLPGAYFAFMAYASGRGERAFVFLRKASTFLAIFGVLATTVLCGVVLTETRGDEPRQCDYVIVLGAGLRKDTPTRALADRLEKAREYLIDNPESIAIVSGGQGKGETVTEAFAMKKYLVSKGIPGSRIIEEEKAENTNENMDFSLEIIKAYGGGSIAVISSDYHIFRARRLAESAGFSPVMISAKTSSSPLFANCIIREALALVKAYLVFI